LKLLEEMVINDTFSRFQKTEGFLEIFSKIHDNKTINKVIIEEHQNTDDDFTRRKLRNNLKLSLKEVRRTSITGFSDFKNGTPEKEKGGTEKVSNEKEEKKEKRNFWLEIKKKLIV
jgi:hypothetical protein